MKKIVESVIPVIYCFTATDINGHPVNDGWCKIGYTERDAVKRINQICHTAGNKPIIHWVDNAVYAGSRDCFNDHDFHDYLKMCGVENMPGTEWFKITPEDAQKHFDKFRKRTPTNNVIHQYKLRKEQEAAIEETINYINTHTDKNCLWNAKPRFGKTLSVYDFCYRINAKKVLIVTGRPAVANSWYDDYVKFFGRESGYFFVSNTDELKNKELVMSYDSYEQYKKSREKNPDSREMGIIYFVSLQDLKGSCYFGEGVYQKLKEIKLTEWDLLVIDEAHEGVDTYKTEIAFENIKRKYTLHLTGTAFKALVKGKFNDDAIYSWTYVDEQEAKRNWDGEGSNPYLELPQLSMMSYRLPNIFSNEIKKSAGKEENVDYGFKLNSLFETDKAGNFIHDAEVDKFLDTICSGNKYPFSQNFRKEILHTFWLLYRVASVKALERKLRVHPVFKDYEIVIAAGDGRKEDYDDIQANKKSFGKVRDAIEAYKTTRKKTITLSVGQLTTGVTIPEWTGVLFLSEQSSAERYMQTIFRVQNPWFYYDEEDKQFHRKEEAFVFDFNQGNALIMMEQFANDLSSDTAGGRGDIETRKNNVKRLIDCFPIYGEGDDGKFSKLSAQAILTIPRQLKSDEVVRCRFMSNALFQNIASIFKAPPEVQNILRKLPAASKPDRGINIDSSSSEKLYLDENNNVKIPESVINEKTANVFPMSTENINEKIKDGIRKANPGKAKRSDTHAVKTEKEIVTKSFIETAKTSIIGTIKGTGEYKNVVNATLTKEMERTIEKSGQAIVNKIYQQNAIDRLMKTEEAQAKFNGKTDEESQTALKQEIESINETFNKKLSDDIMQAADDFVEQTSKECIAKTETKKVVQEKEQYEDDLRNHMRGFARTIPSFLMAYGDNPDLIEKYGKIRLENLDKYVSSDVFKEVTGITVAQFKLLRDGGQYIDSNGDFQEYEGHVFDTLVFNDSIDKFLELKEKLKNYFDESQNEDIFNYIPPQKTNQIFTPKEVVKDMCDLLKECEDMEKNRPGCFDDPNTTFLDPYMKSGLFIAEIVKRLYNSENIKYLIPDDKERLKHIFKKQVYGLAPTEIIYNIAKNFVLGFDDSLKLSEEEHNLRCYDATEDAKNGTLYEVLQKMYNL